MVLRTPVAGRKLEAIDLSTLPQDLQPLNKASQAVNLNSTRKALVHSGKKFSPGTRKISVRHIAGVQDANPLASAMPQLLADGSASAIRAL